MVVGVVVSFMRVCNKFFPLFFIVLGRAPTFFRRFSGVTYGIVFFGAFLWGAGSYQKKCVAKILSLENSVLADRFRKIVKKR